MMFWFILSIAIGLFSSLLSLFAFDDGYLWEREQFKDNTALRMPSLDDLKTQDTEAVKDYVRNEIIPATMYFVLKDEYELSSRQDNTLFYIIAIHFPLLLLAVTSAREFIPLENTLLVGIMLALFVAEVIVASVIYEKMFSIDKFNLDDAKIVKIKEDIRCESIADYNALNNRLIHIRLDYLLSHAKGIKYRLFARKLVIAVGCFSYLLFVPTLE